MNMRDIDPAAIEREQIRALQDRYQAAHAALENWGAYSRDRDDRPAWITAPSWPHQVDSSKWEIEDEGRYEVRVEYAHPPERGDRREPEPHDEKAAIALCERIHGPGGLPDYLRATIKTAYYKPPICLSDCHIFCKPPTTQSGFRERLEECLKFVSRWI